MYDELERAVAGPPRKGMGALGWIVVGFLSLVLVGGIGVVGMGLYLASQVGETVRGLETTLRSATANLEAEGIGGDPARSLAEAMIDLNPELELMEVDDEADRLVVRNLATEEVSRLSPQEVIRGHFELRTDEGVLRFDLRGDAEGGSLVIRDQDGEVFSLHLDADEEGGHLTVRKDGEVRADVRAGEHPVDVPSWVPAVPDVVESVGVFSAFTGAGDGGALLLESAAHPEDLLEEYADALAEAGFEPTLRGRVSDGSDVEITLIGERHDDGRFVALLVTRDDGVTRVLQSWGARDR